MTDGENDHQTSPAITLKMFHGSHSPWFSPWLVYRQISDQKSRTRLYTWWKEVIRHRESANHPLSTIFDIHCTAVPYDKNSSPWAPLPPPAHLLSSFHCNTFPPEGMPIFCHFTFLPSSPCNHSSPGNHHFSLAWVFKGPVLVAGEQFSSKSLFLC